MNAPGNLCPHCGRAFDKPPRRKTKCKACGNFVLLRTDPDSRQRILVTEAQAQQLEERWTQKYHYSRVIRTDRPGFDEERELLGKKFGSPPRDTDVTWSILNKERLLYSTEQKWGLYRNATLNMGDVLRIENRPSEAARFYLEVCYLDLNKPTNYGPVSYPALLEKHPRWSADPNGLAPGVLGLIDTVATKGKLSDETLCDLFMEQATRIRQSLGLPMSPEDALRILREKLMARSGST
jgi:hypothetical protein